MTVMKLRTDQPKCDYTCMSLRAMSSRLSCESVLAKPHSNVCAILCAAYFCAIMNYDNFYKSRAEIFKYTDENNASHLLQRED